MERLTKKNDGGDYYYPKCFEKCNGLGASSKCDNCEIMTSVCEKLGEFEDLEEQGLLLRLPAEAYFIKDNIVRKGWVQELVYSPCRKLLLDIRYDDSSLDSYRGYLGNDVFLTQAEAEQKLKEMESD